MIADAPHVTRYSTCHGQSYPQARGLFSLLELLSRQLAIRHSVRWNATKLAANPPFFLTGGPKIVSNSGFPARTPCKQAILWPVGLA